MTSLFKAALYIVLAFIALSIVLKVIKLATAIFSLLLPLAIVAGIGLFLYHIITSKCMNHSGRSFR